MVWAVGRTPVGACGGFTDDGFSCQRDEKRARAAALGVGLLPGGVALGARLRSGRFLNADDNRRDARRVAVVNQAVVRQFFSNGDPVGRTIYFNGPYEIVGVKFL